jgi:hypothetical protein
MNKKELKELIKPLVKECIEESVKEVVLESGLLSQVISEVMKGVGNATIVETTQKKEPEELRMSEIVRQSEQTKISESRKQMLNAIGKTSYAGVNVFEGINETIPDEPSSAGPANPMQGIAPHDPGVDITQLFDFNKAKILAQGKKRNK